MNDAAVQWTVNALLFVGIFLLVRLGWPVAADGLRRQERWYDRVLNQQLLLGVPPRQAVMATMVAMVLLGLLAAYLVGGWLWFFVGVAVGAALPNLVVRHLEQKRRERLEEQLVDGITTLASGVRAGLNLVQAMELLVKNFAGPIKQEFAQLLREYQMGLDLNAAMRNAANRIGSPHYRLLFTAIEMHRLRGGDTGESLDRINESIREIQRLEGKLDAITAQGRAQARMMSAMPIVFLVMLSWIMPDETSKLFTEPLGRVILLIIVALVAAAYVWIRRIMAVDI